MLDTSPWLLWGESSGVLDFYPYPSADFPQARRLQIVMAEALTYPVPSVVIAAIYAGWAELLEGYMPMSQPKSILKSVRTVLLDVIAGRGRVTEALVDEGRSISRAEAETRARAEATEVARDLSALRDAIDAWNDQHPALDAAGVLIGFTSGFLASEPLTPEASWDLARMLLLSLAEVVGNDGERVMAACAAIAYPMVFARRWSIPVELGMTRFR